MRDLEEELPRNTDPALTRVSMPHVHFCCWTEGKMVVAIVLAVVFQATYKPGTYKWKIESLK